MDKQNETPATSPVQHEMKEFFAGFARVEAEVRAVPERDLVLVNFGCAERGRGSGRVARDCPTA